jgi:hypothetical protein
MDRIVRLALATTVLVLAPWVSAETLTEAAGRVCENVKQCMLAQIDEADMTPEMREMMMPMVDTMCEAMRQGIEEVPTGHELYPSALACMQSLAELSCADFQEGDSAPTPACQAYQEKAQARSGQ